MSNNNDTVDKIIEACNRLASELSELTGVPYKFDPREILWDRAFDSVQTGPVSCFGVPGEARLRLTFVSPPPCVVKAMKGNDK